jgi:hypothetical protein
MNTRRQFLLRSSVQLSAGLAVTKAATSAAAAANNNLLPTVKIGNHEITRLIMGSNPFYGYSHASKLLDAHMKEWGTQEHVCAALQECERSGINTFQTNGDDRATSDIQCFREKGGKLNVIALIKEKPEEVVSKMKPTAVSHHGEVTDVCFRQGKMEDVHEFTKRARQTGVLVGVSTHKPEVIKYMEDANWDVDFFMGCCYNRTRTPDEIRKLLGELPLPPNELYLEKDPERMFSVMRQSSHHCFAFKILAAGRAAGSPTAIDAAFKTAYQGIKPKDAVIIGIYPRFTNQIEENAKRVRALTVA